MITWIKREEKMPVEQFDEVEARLEVQFPQDYVNWVQQYRRPESGHGHILINEEHYHFDEFYDPEEIFDEVEALYFGEEEFKEKGLIVPFGFDSALNRYCFFYDKNKENPVIIWFSSDDALSEIFDSTGFNLDRVRVVGSSFTEFIISLYERTDY
ncbi:SMI1/KNR4 family protein SUKH-1 [Laceyella sediminis]|uniref:SMI1/KNR4 family protein SUKH-1 n=1 Tax=Laceyella sediminis TaxID=573074 RepID=A0ABX5EP35_9BACL|nr:SMI1/KNR4 family protein [Laceyella sediminis]PRZ14450.1 SMI1/KNR4 family protein SUKH-1 [Laceyella sediminis]